VETTQTNQTVTIDGKQYSMNSLSETARNQIVNLRVSEQEIARAQALLAILQTARQAYALTLKEELAKMESLEKIEPAGMA
jgi:hypothetical protein